MGGVENQLKTDKFAKGKFKMNRKTERGEVSDSGRRREWRGRGGECIIEWINHRWDEKV